MKRLKTGFLCGLAMMVLLSQPATAISVHSGVVIGGLAQNELSQPLTGMHWLDLKLYEPSIPSSVPVYNVPVYIETHNVLFTNGAFSVTLAPVPMEIGGGFLGFSVDNGPDTQPRLPLQPLRSRYSDEPLEVLAFDRNAISGATQLRGSLLSYDYDSVSVVPYVVTSTGQVLYTGSAVNSDAVGRIFDLALGSLPFGLAPGDPDQFLRLALTAKQQDVPVLIDRFEMPLTFTASNVRIELQHMSVATVPIPPAVWLFGSGLFGLVSIARRKRAIGNKQP